MLWRVSNRKLSHPQKPSTVVRFPPILQVEDTAGFKSEYVSQLIALHGAKPLYATSTCPRTPQACPHPVIRCIPRTLPPIQHLPGSYLSRLCLHPRSPIHPIYAHGTSSNISRPQTRSKAADDYGHCSSDSRIYRGCFCDAAMASLYITGTAVGCRARLHIHPLFPHRPTMQWELARLGQALLDFCSLTEFKG
jgi:hypothetical protein